jgi:Domain of unknown function (DUF4129)
MFARMANRRLRRFVLLFAIGSTIPLATFSQSPNSVSQQSLAQPLTLQEYIAELDHCAASLNGSPVDSRAVHELRTTLPAKWIVTTGNARYAIGTEWLSGALSSIETDPSASNSVLAPTRQKLEALRQEAQSLVDSIETQQSAAQSRNRLNAILSAREFRGQPGPTWLDVWKQRIRDWIDRQLERIFGRVPGRKIGNWVAWIVVILGGLLLLFWTLRFLMHAGQHSEMDLSGATPVGRDWRRWLREAREAAGRGDYRTAIHAAYWAAIVRMEELKALPEDRARTPRESLKLIDRGSVAYAPLLQLTRRFELVWYGYRAATAADWADAAQQLETLGCPRS